MFSPKFSVSFDIKYNLVEIDRLKYRIERMLIMPKHEEWLRREAFIRTAYSSTMIENATITEDEMEHAVKPSLVASVPKERQDVVNYRKALEFVDFLSDMGDIAIPAESIIRQIHWSLMAGIHDTQNRPGQYRNGPNWIEDRGVKVYEPPFHIDAPILMKEFSEWLKNDKGTSPVLKAGIAHLHLVAIHPFVDGNGRTARLFTTFLLQSSEYGFRKLLSLDAYYQRDRDDYIEALRQTVGNQFQNEYDSTEWLKFFTESLVVQARLLEKKLTDWRMGVEEIHRDLGNSGLNGRQIDGLIYATRMGYITRKDYAEIANVSLLTASRDLSGLVQRNLLKPEGMGRNRRYNIRQPQG